MRKFFSTTLLLTAALLLPMPVGAGVDVGVSISLPPLIVFSGPPEVVVIPETNVYAVPDVDVDIFFYEGWWWRPWEGRWYRSQNYNSGWQHYKSAPSFHRGIPPGWRNSYREGRWKGHHWERQRIPHQQVQKNWRNWKTNKHWEKQNSWGVRGLRPQTQSRQQNRTVQKPTRQVQQQSRPQRREVQHPQQQEKHDNGKGGGKRDRD